jgi:hypothetical protein
MQILSLYNISSSRFILRRHLFAKEIYLPMEGGCQDPVYNTWTILRMRIEMFRLFGISDRSSSPSEPYKKKVMTLIKRSANSAHTRNNRDLVRQWDDAFTNRMLAELNLKFSSFFEIRLFNDRNHSLMTCFECQVRVFAETDILIGVHGAGLGMALYMPPNSAVVEIAPYPNDGRCLLGGGPFSRLASVLSHNYMMHHPPYEEFRWINGKTSEFNISLFVTHVESFLYSIDLINTQFF